MPPPHPRDPDGSSLLVRPRDASLLGALSTPLLLAAISVAAIGCSSGSSSDAGDTGVPDAAATDTAIGDSRDAKAETRAGDAPDAGPGKHVTVVLRDFAFDPQDVTITVGDTIDFVWEQGNHNVVSGKDCKPDMRFRSGDPRPPPNTWPYKFDIVGTVEYYDELFCDSRNMLGYVHVEP